MNNYLQLKKNSIKTLHTKYTDIIQTMFSWNCPSMSLKSYVTLYLTKCEVNYYILYQYLPMVVTIICKTKIDFTKLSSKTAVIQYILKLLTT